MALSCGSGARGRIRTDDPPFTSRMLGVDLDGSRSIWPAHDGGSSVQTDPDRSRRIVWMINRMSSKAGCFTTVSAEAQGFECHACTHNPRIDGVVATFDGPARAIRCVAAIERLLTPVGLPIRAGLHTGEMELLVDDIGGIAVHITARLLGLSGPGQVLVSSTVKDLVVGSGITFKDRGACPRRHA